MTRVESGIKAGPFTIRFIQGQNVKLLVGRNDRGELPHLTISCRNPTGEIDIHLTTRIKGGLDHYESLGKISESEATKFTEEFGARLGIFLQPRIDDLRKIRPGWLARKGYWIMHLSNDTQNRLIETLSPKKKHHGKWTRFIEDNVFEQLGQSQEFVDSFYHPSVLHELAGLGCREVVFATSTHRRRRGRLIGLCLMVRPNGQRCWTRIDKLTQLMLRMSEEFFADCVGRFVPRRCVGKDSLSLKTRQMTAAVRFRRGSESLPSASEIRPCAFVGCVQSQIAQKSERLIGTECIKFQE